MTKTSTLLSALGESAGLLAGLAEKLPAGSLRRHVMMRAGSYLVLSGQAKRHFPAAVQRGVCGECGLDATNTGIHSQA